MSGESQQYETLPGAPSDQVADILATGGTDITTLFVSMAQRHPDGADAEYLRWHTLDHRPEQQRLASIRTSLRVVSTPECRAQRAASSADFDAVDHVMTYFFTGPEGLDEFGRLSTALRAAGRSPFILEPVQRGVYAVADKIAAPRARLGCDVLPWLPVRGLYLLVEQGALPRAAHTAALADVPGVAGVWSGHSTAAAFSSTAAEQLISYCFLDDDPLAVAARLRPVLEKRWRETGAQAMLAGPFYSIVPYEWNRYLP